MEKRRKKNESDPFPGPPPVSEKIIKKYSRGNKVDTDGIRTNVRRIQHRKRDKEIRKTVEQSARNELLLTEEPGFLEVDSDSETYEVKQREIVASVDITSATKHFDLRLMQFGPYGMNYSRNGRYLLLGGRRGHVAAFDWVTKSLLCEINVMESVHDVRWLHNHTMFATAQKNWVFVYDNKGTEIHCIKKLYRIQRMEFLPYHFLLATGSENGYLSWLDVSIGKLVANYYTKVGGFNVLCQNPSNAVLLSGHANGTVNLWSPNVQEPLVKMLCHPHPVRSLAVDKKGSYLATSSMDKTLKIWDLRNYKCLHSYRLGAAAGHMNFSQRDLLAVARGNLVEVYKDICTKDITSPYLQHHLDNFVSGMEFGPYEDVLGVCHNYGFTSLLVPGSGEPNFDAFESNPYLNKKQRREMEVKQLLEKIQPEMITLDPGHLRKVDVKTLKDTLDSRKHLLHVKPPKIDFEPKKKKRSSGTVKTFHRKKGVEEERKRAFIQKQKQTRKSKPGLSRQKKTADVLSRFKT